MTLNIDSLISKLKIWFFNIGDFPLEKYDFSLYFQGKLENRGSKLNVVNRYKDGSSLILYFSTASIALSSFYFAAASFYYLLMTLSLDPLFSSLPWKYKLKSYFSRGKSPIFKNHNFNFENRGSIFKVIYRSFSIHSVLRLHWVIRQVI